MLLSTFLTLSMLWELAHRRQLWTHFHQLIHILQSLCGVYSALGIFQKFQLTTDRRGERLPWRVGLPDQEYMERYPIPNTVILFYNPWLSVVVWISSVLQDVSTFSYLTKLYDFYIYPYFEWTLTFPVSPTPPMFKYSIRSILWVFSVLFWYLLPQNILHPMAPLYFTVF